MRRYSIPLFLLSLFSITPFACASEPLATIPFVGCAADGQQGPVAPPKGQPKHLAIPQSAAEHLAWYQFNLDESTPELGTLAPRGWHCFGTYGSNGSAIYIAPEPLNADKLIFRKDWKGFVGPAIELRLSVGDTSGRFEVARVIARVFPTHLDFVRDVIAEGVEPSSDFPTGPFATDHLIYKSKELVEFTTPAGHNGLGTMSWLLPSDRPISGIACLSGEESSLIQFDTRLPTDLAPLGPIIVRQAEQELDHPTR